MFAFRVILAEIQPTAVGCSTDQAAVPGSSARFGNGLASSEVQQRFLNPVRPVQSIASAGAQV